MKLTSIKAVKIHPPCDPGPLAPTGYGNAPKLSYDQLDDQYVVSLHNTLTVSHAQHPELLSFLQQPSYDSIRAVHLLVNTPRYLPRLSPAELGWRPCLGAPLLLNPVNRLHLCVLIMGPGSYTQDRR
jgi:hypothetical protein